LLVTAAGVFSGGTVALATWWLPAALASGLAATTTAVAGVWLARGTQLVAVPGVRIPLVRDLDDPVALGVHRAAGRSVPVFIARDVTEGLHEVLRRDRFVLIVGESTAGKTRLAYETVRALLPNHRLVEPASRASAQDAVSLAVSLSKSVVWLDDLERFLGTGGLTAAGMRDVLAGPDRFVLATLRAEEYARFSGPRGVGEPAQEVLRAGWDIIRLATRVDLGRSWSGDELSRAREHVSDPRIADALAHAADFGVAEYVASGPQLLAAWRDAWAPGTHPRAAAMVLAAVDARRVGVHRPLPPALLTRLHVPYLAARGADRLRPESVEEALAWATTPLYATSSLLLPSDGFLAFDYLIDAIERDPIPAAALDELIPFATPDEAQDIGEYAWRFLHLAQAHAAFCRAEDGGKWAATERRCDVTRVLHGSDAAIEFAKSVVAQRENDMDSRQLLLSEIGHGGDPVAAFERLESLLAEVESVLGPEDERTLGLSAGVAWWAAESGDPAAALSRFERLVPTMQRVLGREHEMTLVSRYHIANCRGKVGDANGAISAIDELEADLHETGYTGSMRSSLRFLRAMWLTEAGRYPEATALWQEIVEDAAVRGGKLNLHTLQSKAEYADCIGRSGDAAGAFAMMDSVVADLEQSPTLSAGEVLSFGRRRAHWIGMARSAPEAVAEFDRLIATSGQLRKSNAAQPFGVRRRRAQWVSRAGNPAEAERDLEELLIEARTILGPRNPVTKEIESDLAALQLRRETR